MRIRRCAVLFFESREDVEFDLGSLLSGGAGLSRTARWLATAPHLDAEVEVDAAQRELLGALSPAEWVDSGSLSGHEPEAVDALLGEGLVVTDDPQAAHRERDDMVRAAHWWSVAALAHRQSRWHGVDGVRAMEDNEFDDVLTRRATCRNFDAGRLLSEALFAQMLQRVFSAQAQLRVGDDMVFLKDDQSLRRWPAPD